MSQGKGLDTVQDYPNVRGKGAGHSSGLLKCPKERTWTLSIGEDHVLGTELRII